MSISVIIAHYAPINRCDFYFSLLKRTVESVRHQNYKDEIQIILCDDGSNWSKELQISGDINILNKPFINNKLRELDIDIYLALPDVNLYRGIKLKRKAFELAKFNKIIVLDDDHPLISKESLARFDYFLNNYKYVRGRVIGPRGLPQLYLSKNAQGTTYGLTKDSYNEVGGFGTYLDDNGIGEDNDILWKMYCKYKDSFPKMACWAGEITTRDLASNRWAERADFNISGGYEVRYQREVAFVNKFKQIYGIHPRFKNPSRQKRKWVEIGSKKTILYEIIYTIIFIIRYPQEFYWKTRKVRNFNHLFRIIKRKIIERF